MKNKQTKILQTWYILLNSLNIVYALWIFGRREMWWGFPPWSKYFPLTLCLDMCYSSYSTAICHFLCFVTVSCYETPFPIVMRSNRNCTNWIFSKQHSEFDFNVCLKWIRSWRAVSGNRFWRVRLVSLRSHGLFFCILKDASQLHFKPNNVKQHVSSFFFIIYLCTYIYNLLLR